MRSPAQVFLPFWWWEAVVWKLPTQAKGLRGCAHVRTLAAHCGGDLFMGGIARSGWGVWFHESPAYTYYVIKLLATKSVRTYTVIRYTIWTTRLRIYITHIYICIYMYIHTYIQAAGFAIIAKNIPVYSLHGVGAVLLLPPYD